MEVFKKIGSFLASMRFAILLLVLLALACAGASFLTQGQTYDWYAAAYSERAAGWIMALSLDDAFHSWWFLLVSGFLCLNLTLCSVLRLPALIRRTRAEADPAHALHTVADAEAEGVTDPEAVFARLRLPKPIKATTEGQEVLFASKNRVGLWGAWVCHIGILLLILGFALGQMTKTEYTVYGVPGQTRPIGDTGYRLTIDDFRIDLRPDDTVEQYTARVTVFRTPEDGTTATDEQTAEISVNNPAKLYGMTLYQNATGWAATVSVQKNGEPLQSEVVCAGEYLPIADKPDLVVFFHAFYPDYVYTPGAGPKTASARLNNPAYLYSIYFRGEVVGMNVLTGGETIRVDSYEIAFTEPQNYTLIQVKKDLFTPLALVGGLLTMLGLFLALYVLPERAWAVRTGDAWTVYGASKKRGALYRDAFLRAAEGKTQSEGGQTDGSAN